jgi:hypothetical protein
VITVHQGIFLHRSSFSLNTQRHSFLTRDQGVLKAISFNRGKITNPLVLQECEILIKTDPKFEFPTLQSMVPKASPEDLSIPPIELFVRYFVADIIHQTIAQKSDEAQAYDFLGLAKTKMKKKSELYSFPTWFLNGWIHVLGIRPIGNPGANDLKVEQGEFILSMTKNPAAQAWNRLILEAKPVEKSSQKELVNLMLFYLSKHTPNLNVSKTLEIINQTLH